MSAFPTQPLLDVDATKGVVLVSRRAFTDAAGLERERREIFDKCWLFLGHGSELKKAGAFVTRAVGGRQLIFCRDAQGDNGREQRVLDEILTVAF